MSLLDAVSVFTMTVKAVQGLYEAMEQARENALIIEELSKLQQILGPAITQLNDHLEKVTDSTSYASAVLDHASDIVMSLDKGLRDALEKKKFSRIWNVYRSASFLKDTRDALNRTLGTSITIVTSLVAMESEARRQQDTITLQRSIEQLQLGQSAAAADGGNAVNEIQRMRHEFQGLARIWLGAEKADELFDAQKAEDCLADALEAFDVQEDEDRFTCGISGEVMLDPVVASNGYTYCRFSMFGAIDNNCSMPGDDDGKGFRIVGNNLDMRGRLFKAVNGSEDKWRTERAAYIDSIATAEADGQLVVARIRAERALQLLPNSDPRKAMVQAALERIQQTAEPGSSEAIGANPQQEMRATAAGQGKTRQNFGVLAKVLDLSNMVKGFYFLDLSVDVPAWHAMSIASDEINEFQKAAALPTGEALLIGFHDCVAVSRNSTRIIKAPYFHPTEQEFPDVAALPDGKVLLVTHLKTQLYDAATDTWEEKARFSQLYKGYSGLAPLPGGRAIYVGWDGKTERSSIYDVTADRWTRISQPKLTSAAHERYDMTAVPLPDGRVILHARLLENGDTHEIGCKVFTPEADCTRGSLWLRRKMLPSKVWSPGPQVLLNGGVRYNTALPDGRVLCFNYHPAIQSSTCFFLDTSIRPNRYASSKNIDDSCITTAAPALPDGKFVWFAVPISFP